MTDIVWFSGQYLIGTYSNVHGVQSVLRPKKGREKAHREQENRSDRAKESESNGFWLDLLLLLLLFLRAKLYVPGISSK